MAEPLSILHQVRLLSNLEADGTLCWCQHVFGQQLEPAHTAPCQVLRAYFALHVAAPPQPAEPPAAPQSHLSTCPTCDHAMQEIDKGTLWTCLLPTCKDFGIERMWPDRG